MNKEYAKKNYNILNEVENIIIHAQREREDEIFLQKALLIAEKIIRKHK